MADWTAPLHAPSFSDDAFEKQREAYVKKNGYTVTIPTLDDIIHLNPFTPMTEKEKELWSGTRLLTQEEQDEYRNKPPYKEPPARKATDAPSKKETGYTPAEWRKQQRALIPIGRLMDIKEEKQKKKDKYLAMLADPSPKIARNAAAILTSIDDIQDAISTLACVGMVAAAIIGGPIAAAVLGPLGLILGASTLLNLLNPMSHLRKMGGGSASGRAAKIRLEKQTSHNPFSKQSKVSLAKKLKKFRPTVGNAIEALQTTDQIFGVGISIGPIMGFVQGAISGVIRSAMGEKVTLAIGSPKPSKMNDAAAKALRATALLNGYQWHSDARDETLAIYAASLGMQALYNTVQDWNPVEEVQDIGSYWSNVHSPPTF